MLFILGGGPMEYLYVVSIELARANFATQTPDSMPLRTELDTDWCLAPCGAEDSFQNALEVFLFEGRIRNPSQIDELFRSFSSYVGFRLYPTGSAEQIQENTYQAAFFFCHNGRLCLLATPWRTPRGQRERPYLFLCYGATQFLGDTHDETERLRDALLYYLDTHPRP